MMLKAASSKGAATNQRRFRRCRLRKSPAQRIVFNVRRASTVESSRETAELVWYKKTRDPAKARSRVTWISDVGRVFRPVWRAGSKDPAYIEYLGERFSVQRDQAAPGFLGRRLVVDAGVGRTPAVRPRIHFDFCRQVHLRERLFQDVLLGRRTLIIIRRDGDEEL